MPGRRRGRYLLEGGETRRGLSSTELDFVTTPVVGGRDTDSNGSQSRKFFDSFYSRSETYAFLKGQLEEELTKEFGTKAQSKILVETTEQLDSQEEGWAEEDLRKKTARAGRLGAEFC